MPPEAMGSWCRSSAPGVVIVGSHVRKTSAQLEVLLREPGLAAIEAAVDRI